MGLTESKMVDCSADSLGPQPFIPYEDKIPPALKVVLIGDAGVGKTSIIAYLKHGVTAALRKQTATIGPPLPVGDVRVSVDNRDIKLSFWDTCGQERFFSLGPSFMRDADAVVLVYSVASHDSLNHLFEKFRDHTSWLDSFLQTCSHDSRPIFYLLGNKADLAHCNTSVTPEKVVDRVAKEADTRDLQPFTFFETSAQDGKNIQEFQESLARTLLEKYPRKQLPGDMHRMEGAFNLPSFAEEQKRKKAPKSKSKISSCFGSVFSSKSSSHRRVYAS